MVSEIEYYYAPVLKMGTMKFCWFAENLFGASPQEAMRIGRELKDGYDQHEVPIELVGTVAKFSSEGRYAMAQIGPDENPMPALVLNPGETDAGYFDGGAEQQAETAAQLDQVEEIPFEAINDNDLIKSVRWDN